MDRKKLKTVISSGIIFAVLFVAIASFALWLTMPSDGALPGQTPVQDFAQYKDPNDIGNIATFIVTLLIMTGILLLAFKYGLGRFVRYFLIFAVFMALWITTSMVQIRIGNLSDNIAFGAFLMCIIATGYVAFRPFGLLANVINFVAAAGLSAIMGFSLGILPVLIGLVALALYDAIAVYKTKHMVALAQGAISSRLPAVVFTAGEPPSDLDLSKPRSERSSEGGVSLIGLGDFIIPTLLVVSANVFIRTPLIFGVSIPAIGAMIGAIIGYFVLSLIAAKYDTAHAGLPPLNSCIIICFLIACLLTGNFAWI